MIRTLLAAPDDEVARTWLQSLDLLERSRLKTGLRSLLDLCKQTTQVQPTMVTNAAPLQASLFELDALNEAEERDVLPQTERLRRRFGDMDDPQLVQHAALEWELLTNERRSGFLAGEIERLAASLSSGRVELEPFDWTEIVILSRQGEQGRKTYYLHWQGGELWLRGGDDLAAGRQLIALWHEWVELRQRHRATGYQRKQLARALGLRYQEARAAPAKDGTGIGEGCEATRQRESAASDSYG